MGTTLTLIDLGGAIALLLWGVHMVQSGIQRAFGPQLRRFLGRTLHDRFSAFLYGRGFQVWTSCSVVCRPTEREARDYAHYYIHEKGDFGAVETLVRERGAQNPNLPPEVFERMKAQLAAGWGGHPLVGTA